MVQQTMSCGQDAIHLFFKFCPSAPQPTIKFILLKSPIARPIVKTQSLSGTSMYP